MHNTKLSQLLKSLNNTEFREFNDFVRSPVFNKNKKLIFLVDLIKDHYPEFDNDKIKEENLFKKIFPGEKYDYFKIKNLISDLLGLGKEYLAFTIYRTKKDSNEKYLLAQLRERNLDSIFEQTHKAFQKKFEKNIVKDEYHLLKDLGLTEELLFYNIPKFPESRLDFFQKELDLFFKYSLIKLLRYFNIMIHEKAQTNCEFNMHMFNEIMAYLEKNTVDNPTIQIQYNIILLSKEKSEKYFFKLKELKSKYSEELNQEDKYMIFMHLSNFCAYVFNNLGRKDFIREHFLLSKEELDNGSIVLGKILYPDFLNHVKVAVRVKEFGWAQKYISSYEHQLTDEKESTLNFCNAVINYEKGKLDEALELFSRTNFPDFILKIQVRLYLLRINYEKESYDQSLAMIDAFRHYLQREKSFIESFKEAYYEFLKLTNELIKIKTSMKTKAVKTNIKMLKDRIDEFKFNQFGIKNWLNDKVDEL